MKATYSRKSTHIRMWGFSYLVYSAFSLSLLFILLLLPIAPVFASEEAIPVGEDTAIAATQEIVEESPKDDIQTEEVTEELQVSVVEDNVSYDVVDPNDVESVEVTQEEDAIQDATIESEIEEEVLPDSETDAVDDTEESVDGIENTEESNLEEELPLEVDEPVNQEEIIQTEAETEDVPVNTASSTEPVVTEAHEVNSDENKYVFSKDECTLAGDGAFFCSKPQSEAAVTSEDRIFSAPDSDGDKEIYIEKDNELTQITFNALDDDAPYFDELSNTIVWHRLIDGRTQIILYDIERGEETQLTNDRYNNMQPNRYGDYTVWQGWVGDDWEIFLYEGDEITMITDNTTHDVTPSVNDRYVVWQSFENDAWHMKVYDIKTKNIETISDTDGGMIQNPRFVLVYDTKFESGDVETKGYDLKSGEVLELGSHAAPIPQDIPDPEQTGEERALVAPPAQPKVKTDSENDDDLLSNGPLASSTDDVIIDTDIIIPPFASSTEDTLPEIEILESEVSVPELILDHATETLPSVTEHIEDIIVTPYTEPIEE
jgi:hypothetical protein